jgi:hypothetical protein
MDPGALERVCLGAHGSQLKTLRVVSCRSRYLLRTWIEFYVNCSYALLHLPPEVLRICFPRY